MPNNASTTNPAASLVCTPEPHRGRWAKLVTLAANAVIGGSAGRQRRFEGTDCASLPRPDDARRWLPPADVFLEALTAATRQTAIVLIVIHLLLFHGGAR